MDEKLFTEYKRRPAQLKLLLYLQDKKRERTAALKEQGIKIATVKKLAEGGLIKIVKERIFRDSYKGQKITANFDNVALTCDQQNALKQIAPAIEMQKAQKFLLYGVTGSGKTMVYMNAAAVARNMGRQVIVLVPEIALTGQLVDNFRARFGEDIIVIHSRLSLSERNDAIMRARNLEAGIVIGARSALFAPLGNIGLIILDEEQDFSYKQDESPLVAEKIAAVNNAPLVLGSATPSMETFHRAKQGEIILLSMPKRVGNMPLPQVECVDMREELNHGNRSVLSRQMKTLLTEVLAKGEQAIIMLNRRGWATFVMCRSCGEVIKCNECTLPMVYHNSNNSGRLVCHHCDKTVEMPKTCPKCGSRYIKYFGSGTEKLESELKEMFPTAKIVRMDRDTTGRKFAHQEIISAFKNRKYDILLGTQMVAKGHDIGTVTAAGIISADSGLFMPDFRAAERTFMLITQTAGRAGRGGKKGKVTVQSYSPGHYAVYTALRQDYEGFFAEEIKKRRELMYPPFCRLIKLGFKDKSEENCRNKAADFAEDFRRRFADGETSQVIGPFAPAIPKVGEFFRFLLLIKTKELTAARDFLREKDLHRNNDVVIDIDPINMF